MELVTDSASVLASCSHRRLKTGRRVLDKSRSDDVFTTITLLVTLLSELEIEFRFGLSDRLKFLWGIIQEYWGEATDLYSRRYSTAL